ncbi:unnamed protein product [Rotaria socialis]
MIDLTSDNIYKSRSLDFMSLHIGVKLACVKRFNTQYMSTFVINQKRKDYQMRNNMILKINTKEICTLAHQL